MKIALIGITGRVGSRVADELLKRGHQVTGIARNLGDVNPQPGLTIEQGDATDPHGLTPLLKGHDAVVSASRFVSADAKPLLAAVKDAGVPRLLVVGGAGSLEIAPGQRLVDSPEFPEQWKQGALGAADALDQLRAEKDLDWAFLSPAMLLDGETRTGSFRVGGDQVLFDGNGESRISLPDLAVAMIDEAEQANHHQQRFTVAY